jgi:hypothetical protein
VATEDRIAGLLITLYAHTATSISALRFDRTGRKIAAMPTSKLTQRTDRQSSALTRTPPRTGPATAAILMVDPHTPTASGTSSQLPCARRRAGTTSPGRGWRTVSPRRQRDASWE